jgi:hypothetical protein
VEKKFKKHRAESPFGGAGGIAMMRSLPLPTSLLMLVLCARIAHAWLRPTYEDATVVERSELIVVAHLKEGSIQHVPHKRKPDEGASWEHHAILVITKVLKGKCDTAEIPIVIHYGLTPRAGDGKPASPKDIIEVHDTGNRPCHNPTRSDA